MFSNKSEDTKRNMELLGLMVNEPNIRIEELHSIQIPTLVIAGKNDMIKESHTREIADNIPNAELSIISGNHFIANNESERFNQEVEKFLIKTLNTNSYLIFSSLYCKISLCKSNNIFSRVSILK